MSDQPEDQAYRAYPIEAENALDAWLASRTEGVWTSPAGWWYAAWMHREAEVVALRAQLERQAAKQKMVDELVNTWRALELRFEECTQ